MKTLEKVQKIDIKSSEYPDKLRQIPNPPKQIYCAGDISLLHRQSVSVVGSRKYTLYGKLVALMIGRRLGECGIPVVSGLANGIDAFSHEGVLEADGRIIGVLASGIRKMGPRRNHALMMRGLENGGLILSEYEPDAEAMPYTFPARNRIISGLCSCLVVVEANFNSGALITAQHAAGQGRTVYAVPGNITSQFSLGSNLLIRDGASPLVVVDDLIRDLGIDPRSAETEYELDNDERCVYEAICRYSGVNPETIAADIGRTAAFVNAVITVLEVKGLIETCGGKIYLAN